jgi:serine/threonine protein kinase
MNLTTGTALRNGKYEIGTVVGQGCFQITYRATHVSSKQSVIIEALNESWRTHPQFNLFQRRFVERVRQIAKCRHPHFIRVFDLFAENGLVYMVTEAIGGATLAESIADGQPLSLRVAVNWIRQVASALRILHQQDVLHLNIKPESIIQRQNRDRVVLANFSIAHHLTLGALQTQVGMLSAGYAPPEQYDPQSQPTPATDVYGLAATLYHLLTGHPPVSASLRDRIPLANLREIQPELSPALERAILQGLELSVDRRSPSIEAWMNPLWREFSAIEAQLRAVEVPSSQPVAEIECPPSPSPDVTATVERVHPREIVEPSLPPQLQPWIPALFVATSAIAGIGGASFVFAQQSKVAIAPTPEFSRLQEAFPSRSPQADFGPDRAFVEAADPQTTPDPELSPSLPPEDTEIETDRSDESETIPVGTAAETALSGEFPLEVESWRSPDRTPIPTVTSSADPESEPSAEENLPTDEQPEDEWNPEQRRRLTGRSPEPPADPSEMETLPSVPPIEIPEYPAQNRSKPPVEAYFLPKSTGEFSAPKQTKPHTEIPQSGTSTYWSNTTPL